jgi:hypothetical protein
MRTTVRRHADRGRYDRGTLDAILDEGLVCHVGFVDEGLPYVIPTAYGRCGDTLYLHGAPASRMLRTLRAGVDLCVTVTLPPLDLPGTEDPAVWTGVIPLVLEAQPPVAAERPTTAAPPPAPPYVTSYARPRPAREPDAGD